MASDWVLHSESNRWVRSIYDHSGEFLYEWDYTSGALTPAVASQASSLAPRQRSTSGSAFPNLEDGYGHQTPFAPGPGLHVQPQDPLDYSQTYTNRMDLNHRSPPTGYQQLPNHRADGEIYPIAGAVTTGKASNPPEWVPEVSRETTGRRTGRPSISDRSEATTSSRSDGSIPRIHVEDPQGLSLGDHQASHMVLSYRSSHSHRNDPILGDAQPKYDGEVQKSLEPGYVIPGSNGERETLDPRYKRQSDPRRVFRIGRSS